MASGPITPWEIDGETVDTVSDFIFWGSKITLDGDCSHEIKMLTLSTIPGSFIFIEKKNFMIQNFKGKSDPLYNSFLRI